MADACVFVKDAHTWPQIPATICSNFFLSLILLYYLWFYFFFYDLCLVQVFLRAMGLSSRLHLQLPQASRGAFDVDCVLFFLVFFSSTFFALVSLSAHLEHLHRVVRPTLLSARTYYATRLSSFHNDITRRHWETAFLQSKVTPYFVLYTSTSERHNFSSLRSTKFSTVA